VIQESKKSHYRGVRCSRCREPIPVSEKVASLQPGLNLEETNAVRTFALRCRSCEEEGVYAVDQTQDFEGEPKSRRLRVPQNRMRSRAANG
jgi:hypothetical protein